MSKYRFMDVGCGFAVGVTWVAALLKWFRPSVAYAIAYGIVGFVWLLQVIWLHREGKRLEKNKAQVEGFVQEMEQEFQCKLKAMRDCWRQVNNTEPPL